MSMSGKVIPLQFTSIVMKILYNIGEDSSKWNATNFRVHIIKLRIGP